MDFYNELCDISSRGPTAIALGTFDGVHIGHQRIISAAARLARTAGGASVVFTFANHPLTVIRPDRCPPLITDPGEKTRLISDLGVDIFLAVPFTPDFSRMPPADFIRSLQNNLAPRHLVVGPNYSFGARGAGTPAMLEAAGREGGFGVLVEDAVTIDGDIVSSTAIRQAVAAGDVGRAARLLGRTFSLAGVVVQGDGRGRLLGYPTANLTVGADLVLPADGVYAVTAEGSIGALPAVVNIGTNPTFHKTDRRIEVHLPGYSGDLYGQSLRLQFHGRIRGEAIFPSADELKNQIARDIESARAWFRL